MVIIIITIINASFSLPFTLVYLNFFCGGRCEKNMKLTKKVQDGAFSPNPL